MHMASNGAALIGSVVVPAAEVKVFKALATIGRPATVPEIAKALEEEFSDASLYSLLNRLHEKRRLVDRREVVMEFHGTKLRRVIWEVHQTTKSNLDEVKNVEKLTKRSEEQPEAGAAVRMDSERLES